MKYLVVVECTDAGGIEIGMAVIRMGYRPLFLLDPTHYKTDLGLSLQNFDFINVDTSCVNEIIRELLPIKNQIAGVTTLVDSKLSIAAKVAKELSIPGPDQACIKLKDKVSVAYMCEEYSLITMPLPKSINEAKEKILTLFREKPVVAKTREGCGAVGIEFLYTEKDKINFIENKNDLDDWIFQEYFDGSLYSMEGWVENSKINFIGWTARKKIRNTETEFRFEGFDSVLPRITNRAKDAIKKLFERSEFKRGWFHIEFLIDQAMERAVMIDANVGRVGGAMVPHILAMSLSKSPAQIYQHAIEIQVFGSSSINLKIKKDPKKTFKCICFGSKNATVIDQVILPKNSLYSHRLRVTKILGTGDSVTRIGHDDWSWIGLVAGEESEVEGYVSKIKIRSLDGVLHPAVF